MTQNGTDRTVSGSSAQKPGRRRLGILFGSLFLVALCVTIRYYWGAAPASADTADEAPARGIGVTEPRDQRGLDARRSTAAARPASAEADATALVATVNTQRITPDELARQCRRRHGRDVLESMVNKHLIVAECRRQGLEVTRAEVDAEIERMAKRFGIPVDQWLKMLKQERNITPAQYANDIIWPTLALRRTAGQRLDVSRDE
jgi:hypothetical protein